MVSPCPGRSLGTSVVVVAIGEKCQKHRDLAPIVVALCDEKVFFEIP